VCNANTYTVDDSQSEVDSKTKQSISYLQPTIYCMTSDVRCTPHPNSDDLHH